MSGKRSDNESGAARKPCKYRRKELKDGLLADWCYAIGFEKLGDLPCNDCQTDRKPVVGKVFGG